MVNETNCVKENHVKMTRFAIGGTRWPRLDGYYGLLIGGKGRCDSLSSAMAANSLAEKDLGSEK